MDMREVYNSQSAVRANQNREEAAAVAVAPSTPSPATFQQMSEAPHQPSSLMTAQARAEQQREEPAATAAPVAAPVTSAATVSAAEPQLFEPLGGREDPFAGMEDPSSSSLDRADTSPEVGQTARPGGALGFLKGLARGGFSKAATTQDVHEAEERERRVRENGFDQLARPAFEPDGPAEPVATRGLNGPGQQPTLTSLSTTPTGVDPLDVDESEINIPAFLRRQMN